MNTEYILFDFADDTPLLDKPTMVRLLIRLAEGDVFQFLKKAIVCDDSPGEIYVPNTPETLAGAWNNAYRAVQRYNGYWMEAENADHLKFSFGFSPSEARRLLLTARKVDLRTEAPLRAFLSFAEAIIEVLRPVYGFGLFSYDSHSPPEIGAEPSALWDYNYFSPPLIERFGRETLAALPAYRQAEIGGGRLIELSPNPITRPTIKNYREASAALGFSKYYQGG